MVLISVRHVQWSCPLSTVHQPCLWTARVGQPMVPGLVAGVEGRMRLFRPQLGQVDKLQGAV